MLPAFSSNWQKALFVLTLALVLASPLLAGRRVLPPREEIYSAAAWGLGAFPYLQDQIFHETNDIDIAFMGSSIMWWGIDTPQVQAALAQSTGRPAVVRSLCWNWNGLDAFYFIAQDLLEHRRVRMLVFNDMSPAWTDTAHAQALHWFRYADNAGDLAGLDGRAKASFYTSTILGLPRSLIGALRPDLGVTSDGEISWGEYSHVANPARQLGSLSQRHSMFAPFADFTPVVRLDAAAVRVGSAANRTGFVFSSKRPPAAQVCFARKIAELARKHGTKLVYLHLPRVAELDSAVIPENADWPELFPPDLTLAGVPANRLFAGLSREQCLKLYCDFWHFNQNGQKYFTAVMTPTLVQLYEKQNQP